jgi:hypothetical protein
MSVRLTTRIAAVMMMIVGAVAVPSAASAATFVCGEWAYNSPFSFRACIDDTNQGDMWYEIQLKHSSGANQQIKWTTFKYENSVTTRCTGPWTVTVEPLKTWKMGCVGPKRAGSYYMTLVETVYNGRLERATSPVLSF